MGNPYVVLQRLGATFRRRRRRPRAEAYIKAAAFLAESGRRDQGHSGTGCGPQLFCSGRSSGSELFVETKPAVAGGIRSDSWSDPLAICFKQFSASLAISFCSRRRRCGHVPNSRRRICSCANSWRCTRSVRSSRGAPMTDAFDPRPLVALPRLASITGHCHAGTLIRWHRKGFRLFWSWKSRAPGRPAIPADMQRLIATMAAANRTWGEERIAHELLVKLGIRLSPRTVRRYIRCVRDVRGRGPKRGAHSYGTTLGRSSRVISSSW